MGSVLSIYKASICSVTRIAPNSAAKAEPTCPAIILAVKIGANSRQNAKAKAPPTLSTAPNLTNSLAV
jgi:hypothetical protein